MSALRFDAVSFTYPDADRPALHDASVRSTRERSRSRSGPTGAGKSTFLRAANGLVPHFTGGRFSGRVVVDGRDTLEHAPRALADAVAYVPQDAGGLVRARPRGGRARLRHGEPRGRPGAHAPARRGDARPARRRAAAPAKRAVALGRRAAAGRDRSGARSGASHPRARRADLPARPAGRRARGRRPAAARARPGHDRAARRAPTRAGRRLRRSRPRLRARHGRAPASRPR